MKTLTSAIALAAACAAFSYPAMAQAITGAIGTYAGYTLVDSGGNPIPLSGNVNSDYTVASSCTGCTYRTSVAGDPSTSEIGVPGAISTNPVTGNTTAIGADGVALVNSNGATTLVTSAGVQTNGAVSAKTLSDGAGTTITGGSVTANSVSAANGDFATLSTAGYGNVGNTLTNLYDLYHGQQAQINTLNSNMTKAFEGIAMASAFHSPQVDPGHTFGLSFSAADFNGYSGFSGAGKLRINNNFAVGIGGAMSDRGSAAGQVYGEVQW